MKIGLDIHGVANEQLDFFRTLTFLLTSNGHEVHVVTGPTKAKAMVELEELGICYTHLFSITDYHVEKGTPVEFDAKGNPHMDVYQWDKTKADYCLEQKIDLHLDDSDAYGYFFKTPYARYYSKNKRKHYIKQ